MIFKVSLLFSTKFSTIFLSCTCVSVAQLNPTLCNPTDCSLPGFFVRVFQARILEWVAILLPQEAFLPGDQACESLLLPPALQADPLPKKVSVS